MSAATVVALPRRQNMEQLQWLAPAPLWDAGPVGAAASGLIQPWIAELRTDSFVSDFLGLLSGRDGASPAALADTVPHRRVGGAPDAAYRLFQPLSQCYYLVSATLACRRPGIPDHAVNRAKGDRVSFVMRRVDADGEQAWVPGGTGTEPGSPPTGRWLAASADELAPGEEKYPMHPAPVAAFAPAGSTAAALGMAEGTTSTRTVFYGYIPVGQRERMVPVLADPVASLADYQPPVGNASENPWLFELVNRVIEPWKMLAQPAQPDPKPPVSKLSLYVLLDLADWLGKYLPKVYQAIITDSPVTGAEHDLLDQLRKTTVQDSGEQVPIADALVALKDLVPLVNGPDMDTPNTYDLTHPPLELGTNAPRDNWFGSAKQAQSWSLADYALAALDHAAGDPTYSPQIPPELRGLIKIDPVEPAKGTTEPTEQTYVIRAVFEHNPCQPVLSAPSHGFVLARAVDAEAPARKVRIQLPDITNLRQFQRGVAMEMSPSMRRIMAAITPDSAKDILDGKEFQQDSGLSLGMICSFSLQIIFVCAFIILLMFVLLLNIVFWWKAFLKICFPIPKKAVPANGSQP